MPIRDSKSQASFFPKHRYRPQNKKSENITNNLGGPGRSRQLETAFLVAKNTVAARKPTFYDAARISRQNSFQFQNKTQMQGAISRTFGGPVDLTKSDTENADAIRDFLQTKIF